MAFSCAGARLDCRTGVKCRPGAAALPGRRGTWFPTAASAASARGIRADLPRMAVAVPSGPAVAVPETGDATTDQVAAVVQPVVLPERLDVDVGGGGNGKLLPAGGGGGGDVESGGGWFGGAGDGDEGEDEFGPILSFDQVIQEAEKRGVTLPSLPADMVEAAKSVGIQKLLQLRYLDMQASAWPLGPAIRSCSLLRNRMLFDPAFLFKIGTEIIIDTCCATFAEVQKRGEFWSEFELYVADMLVGVVVSVALVGMLGPYARFGSRSASSGLLGCFSLPSLPADMVEAAKSIGIQKLLLRGYPNLQFAYIQRWHEFAYCPLDTQHYRTAIEYGWYWDTRLTETVNVPGHVRQGETFLRGRNDTLVVLRRMFNCLWLVHLSGLTIRGQFGAKNFMISSHLSVRLRGVQYSSYTTDQEGTMDYKAFEGSVRDMFVLEVIPADIERWLQLIGMGVRYDRGYLLRYYIALMEPQQQLQTLFRSRRLIERLRLTDYVLYQHIIRLFFRYLNWDRSDRVNDFLRATQYYVNPSGVAAQHSPTISGVLKLVRDFWEHPPVEMDEAECIAVVQDDFPRLLRDVHEALSQAGLLGQLDLEAIMS